jgi:dihydrofolate reductase
VSDDPSEPLALIVAWAGPRRVIGRAGSLPWRLPEDLRRFRDLTMGHALLMGRRTFESIGRALPGRRNLVLTRRPGWKAPGVEVHRDFEEALEAARSTDPCPFVIGGERLYALALPLVTRMEVTEIAAEVEGDTFFPAFEEAAFEVVAERPAHTVGVRFVTYARVGVPPG